MTKEMFVIEKELLEDILTELYAATVALHKLKDPLAANLAGIHDDLEDRLRPHDADRPLTMVLGIPTH